MPYIERYKGEEAVLYKGFSLPITAISLAINAN